MIIELSLEKNVEENAQIYFEKAKKLRKKLEGAKNALEISKKKLRIENENKKELESKREQLKFEKTRKKEWFEQYRWFYSSDGFLVVGGKDASSNETVIKKHMEQNDLIYHTEAPGSPFMIIKNPDKKGIPETTKIEAATCAATFSKAWIQGIKRIEVMEVKPEQVTKTAKAGEYISKGAFMIYGKRKHYNVNLSLAIGFFQDEEGRKIIMSGPESAVIKKCEKYLVVKQGDMKKGEFSKKIMNKLEVHINDDILSALPSGKFSLAK